LRRRDLKQYENSKNYNLRQQPKEQVLKKKKKIII
jgi:hypothetical protein